MGGELLGGEFLAGGFEGFLIAPVGGGGGDGQAQERECEGKQQEFPAPGGGGFGGGVETGEVEDVGHGGSSIGRRGRGEGRRSLRRADAFDGDCWKGELITKKGEDGAQLAAVDAELQTGLEGKAAAREARFRFEFDSRKLGD